MYQTEEKAGKKTVLPSWSFYWLITFVSSISIHPSNCLFFQLWHLSLHHYPYSPTNVPAGPATIQPSSLLLTPPSSPVSQLLSLFCTHVYDLSSVKDGVSQELCLAQARCPVQPWDLASVASEVPLLLLFPQHPAVCVES